MNTKINDIVESNKAARIVDLGDGVGLFELTNKLGVISSEMIDFGLQNIETVTNKFDAVVIANNGNHFSVGANLKEIHAAAIADTPDVIDTMISNGQQWMTALLTANKPVVSAIAGLALGGGSELAASSWASVAHTQSQLGLVERNVGLVPGWGGVVEQLRRRINPLAEAHEGALISELQNIFDQLRQATISTDAKHAQQLGYLRTNDLLIADRHNLLPEAKQLALQLTSSDQENPTSPFDGDVYWAGKSAFLTDYVEKLAGEISGHDRTICQHLITVLTGGDITPRWVQAQQVRRAERHALVRLAKTSATQDRMDHMLKTGKPLHN